MEQDQTAILRRRRITSHDLKLLVIGFSILAILSPLYIDRRSIFEPEIEEVPIFFSSCLSLLLLGLILGIAFSCFLETGFAGFDPYWIHRVGGSSTGIIIVLVVLGLVLKFKSSLV
ncbi:uncharacterized protein LOC111379570 [Olea europaea subsp. europaea]|uniref:Uncharacterized protein LOC111379570 n=1 Tax=Olea europaea subsp. europaea TaxID=158383 RepID=A0A8S0PF33_OLEEU|nr:uncharacterized protein LOC111379570 [Olea europaea subsp. europaea]